jgi:DNA-nicking Smr family endonuclease
VKNKPPQLPENDQQLWESFTKDIRKISSDRIIIKTASKEKITVRKIDRVIPETKRHYTVQQLTSREVRNIVIERSVDLHGLTLEIAKKTIEQFILQSYHQNLKWVLIVTGKGNLENPGVLRENLPKWLEKLATLVTGYTSAHIKDGGSGAFYIKIRRNRVK